MKLHVSVAVAAILHLIQPPVNPSTSTTLKSISNIFCNWPCRSYYYLYFEYQFIPLKLGRVFISYSNSNCQWHICISISHGLPNWWVWTKFTKTKGLKFSGKFIHLFGFLQIKNGSIRNTRVS
jgi:hypothetical protein